MYETSQVLNNHGTGRAVLKEMGIWALQNKGRSVSVYPSFGPVLFSTSFVLHRSMERCTVRLHVGGPYA